MKDMAGMTSAIMDVLTHAQSGNMISIRATTGVLDSAFTLISTSFSTAKTVILKAAVLLIANITLNKIRYS